MSITIWVLAIRLDWLGLIRNVNNYILATCEFEYLEDS